MANIPKYSPKGRAALEKQVAEYQVLLDKLLLENPAYQPKAPIPLAGKSETVLDETVTRNPGVNDPGGSTTKNSRTTVDPQTLYAPTGAEDAVRARHDQIRDFIDRAQLDLADEGALAARIPMTTEEALDIASGQVAAMPESKKIRNFSNLLGVKGAGGATDRAQDMLLRGAVPDDGFTFIRSLLSGAREDPRLLAELMGQINNAGGAPRVPFAKLAADYAPDQAELFTEGGVKTWMGTGAPGSAADVANFATQREGTASNIAGDVPGYERGLESLGADALNKISRNRKTATIGGALSAAAGGLTAAMWPTSDVDKFHKKAKKAMFGTGSIDKELYKTDPEGAMENAFASYVDREFGKPGDAKNARYMAMMKKYGQTFARLGAGTLKASDNDPSLTDLRKDVSAFYGNAAGYDGYNAENPISFPYQSGGKGGVISFDRDMKQIARLKDGEEFAAIND